MKNLCVALILITLTHPSRLLASDAHLGWVIGWGSNFSGESTGTPTQGSSTGTVALINQPMNDITAISAGASHSLALRANGAVIGWGYNYYAQTTGSKSLYPYVVSGRVTVDGQGVDDATAIAAGGNQSAALRHGTIAAWGDGHTEVPTGLSNVVSIAVGCSQILALQRGGTVVSLGGRTAVPSDLSNAITISAGSGRYYERNLALKHDGTVVAWGQETIHHIMRQPSGLTNVMAIAAGWNHSLALIRDGTVMGWGANGSGQATGNPTTVSPYISHGLVTLFGEVLGSVKAIAAGNEYSLALKNDGTVVAWGHPPRFALKVWPVPAGLSNVVAIAAGDGFCLAITTNAAVAERFRH